jgi:hypothetical protein
MSTDGGDARIHHTEMAMQQGHFPSLFVFFYKCFLSFLFSFLARIGWQGCRRSRACVLLPGNLLKYSQTPEARRSWRGQCLYTCRTRAFANTDYDYNRTLEHLALAARWHERPRSSLMTAARSKASLVDICKAPPSALEAAPRRRSGQRLLRWRPSLSQKGPCLGCMTWPRLRRERPEAFWATLSILGTWHLCRFLVSAAFLGRFCGREESDA